MYVNVGYGLDCIPLNPLNGFFWGYQKLLSHYRWWYQLYPIILRDFILDDYPLVDYNKLIIGSNIFDFPKYMGSSFPFTFIFFKMVKTTNQTMLRHIPCGSNDGALTLSVSWSRHAYELHVYACWPTGLDVFGFIIWAHRFCTSWLYLNLGTN